MGATRKRTRSSSDSMHDLDCARRELSSALAHRLERRELFRTSRRISGAKTANSSLEMQSGRKSKALAISVRSQVDLKVYAIVTSGFRPLEVGLPSLSVSVATVSVESTSSPRPA